MKRLLGLIASLFALSSVSGQTNVASEYVSIDCPKGDIALELKPDRTFTLELKHWDSKINRHTDTERMAGTWHYASDVLTLRGNGEMKYRRKKTSLKVGSHAAEIDSFMWQRSTIPTFADSFTLVERKITDELLLRAAPK